LLSIEKKESNSNAKVQLADFPQFYCGNTLICKEIVQAEIPFIPGDADKTQLFSVC